RRPHRKPILVEVYRWPVVIEQKAELGRVSLPYRVLSKEIGDVHILVPEVQRVQIAVRVLLQHVEIRRVELITVARVVAEQARSQIDGAKNKSAKVADEGLDSSPD